MTVFDGYNRRWPSRSYSENVKRFAERHGLSEHDVDDLQIEAKRERDRYFEERDQ
jgi:hypothetical protein